jgi:hypothetical protein
MRLLGHLGRMGSMHSQIQCRIMRTVCMHSAVTDSEVSFLQRKGGRSKRSYDLYHVWAESAQLTWGGEQCLIGKWGAVLILELPGQSRAVAKEQQGVTLADQS